MKKSLILLIFTPLFFIHSSLFGQETRLMLQKAEKLVEAGSFIDAIPIFREILMVDDNLKAKEGLAKCYKQVNNSSKSEYWYEILLKKDPNNTNHQFEYAQMLQNNGKCEEAKKWFQAFAQTNDRGNDFIKACEDHTIFYKNEDLYEILEMPFNGEGAEFGPSYFENGLVYVNQEGPSSYSDLYFTEILPGNAYSRPTKMSRPLNSKYNDGPISVSPNGREMWITRNNEEVSKDGKNPKMNLKIMIAHREEGKNWGDLLDFQHNDSNYSVMHPTLTPDGKTLYFVSDKPGGYGGLDIYVCKKNGSKWSIPLNLGDKVNTMGNEVFPSIHSDGVLYFSSNGHAGLGKFDVFYTSQKGNFWSKPENIGSPINSNGDDLSFTINESKTEGYFASNRYGTKGQDDLFYFQFQNPNKTVVLEEKPKDILVKEDSFKPSQDYLLDSNIGLDKIIFEYKKSNLTASAFMQIDKVANYLNNKPNDLITIESFTDSRGEDLENVTLTEDRTRIIQNYLIAKGIDASRITTTGFGEQFLLNDCDNDNRCTDLEHSVNDRVLFKINNPYSFGDEPEEGEFVNFKEEKEKRKRNLVDNKERTIENKLSKEEREKEKAVAKAKKEKERLAGMTKEQREKEREKKKARELRDREKEAKEKQATSGAEKKKKENEDAPKRVLPVPKINVSNNNVGTYYVISVGPYKVIDIETTQILQSLKVTPVIEGKPGKESLLLGNFYDPKDALKVLEYLEYKGLKKPTAITYQNGLSLKKVNLEQIINAGKNK